MATAPTSPAGFYGWGNLAPLEATVWGYLLLPGKRCLRAYAHASAGLDATDRERDAAYSNHKDAKARGRRKLEAAAIAHGCDFATMLDAYRRGQKAMANAPRA